MTGLAVRDAKVPFFDQPCYAMVKEQLADHGMRLCLKSSYILGFLKREDTASMELRIIQQYMRTYAYEVFEMDE